jgi:hypothetical protein
MLFVTSSGRAQEPRAAGLPLELTWNAPSDCASRAQVQAEMERIVRARPGFVLPNLSVNAEVRRTRADYRVRLELTRAGEATRREFQAENCNALVRAATLTIALAFGDGAEIDETSSAEAPAHGEPEPAPPSPPAAAVTAPPKKRDPGENRAKPAQRTLALGIGAAWSPHWLDGNSFGLQAAASLHLPHLMIAWTNRVWIPRTLQPTESASARFWSATTSFAPGVHYRFGAIELELALALQLGMIRGTGADIHAPAQAWAPWYAVAPSVGVGFVIGRSVRIVLGQEFVLTPVRPEFEIESIGTVYRVPVLTPVTTLAIPIDVARF